MNKLKQLHLDLNCALISFVLVNLAAGHHPQAWMEWCAMLGGIIAAEALLSDVVERPA